MRRFAAADHAAVHRPLLDHVDVHVKSENEDNDDLAILSVDDLTYEENSLIRIEQEGKIILLCSSLKALC
jgi:hypothetical protein